MGEPEADLKKFSSERNKTVDEVEKAVHNLASLLQRTNEFCGGWERKAGLTEGQVADRTHENVL